MADAQRTEHENNPVVSKEEVSRLFPTTTGLIAPAKASSIISQVARAVARGEGSLHNLDKVVEKYREAAKLAVRDLEKNLHEKASLAVRASLNKPVPRNPSP